MEADEDKQPHQGDVDGVSMLNLDAVPAERKQESIKSGKSHNSSVVRKPESVRRGGCLWPFAGCRCSWFILILISFEEWTKKHFDKSSLYVQNDVANKLLSKQWDNEA